jgi:RHS repeat-associated protein
MAALLLSLEKFIGTYERRRPTMPLLVLDDDPASIGIRFPTGSEIMTTITVARYAGFYLDPVQASYPLGNGYRSYSCSLMRFNAPDRSSPFGRGGVNPFAYCGANPVDRSDVNGHSWESWVSGGTWREWPAQELDYGFSAQTQAIAPVVAHGAAGRPESIAADQASAGLWGRQHAVPPQAAFHATLPAYEQPVWQTPFAPEDAWAQPAYSQPATIEPAQVPTPSAPVVKPTFGEVLQASFAHREDITDAHISAFWRSGSNTANLEAQRNLLAFMSELQLRDLRGNELFERPNMRNWSRRLGFHPNYLGASLHRLLKRDGTKPAAATTYAILWRLGLVD